MTDCVHVDVHLEGDDLAKRARGRRPRRPRRGTEGAPAEVVLRRPRARELFDEITRLARVLPDPRRAGDPRRARAATIADATGADTLVELGSGTSEKTRLLLDALAGRRHAAALRRRSTSARRRSATRPQPSRTSTTARRPRRRRRLRAPPRHDPRRRAATRRVPRRHDRQPRARGPRRVPRRASPAGSTAATRSSSAPTS